MGHLWDITSKISVQYCQLVDYTGAADEFLRWNKAGGKVLNGLTRRREAERSLFLS
ncbi:glycoside hydrolase family protein [Citrobacter werkmanii]